MRSLPLLAGAVELGRVSSPGLVVASLVSVARSARAFLALQCPSCPGVS